VVFSYYETTMAQNSCGIRGERIKEQLCYESFMTWYIVEL
jgi:hypothetical protein